MTSYPKFPTRPEVGHITDPFIPVSLPSRNVQFREATANRNMVGPAGVPQPGISTPGHWRADWLGRNLGKIVNTTTEVLKFGALLGAARGDSGTKSKKEPPEPPGTPPGGVIPDQQSMRSGWSRGPLSPGQAKRGLPTQTEDAEGEPRTGWPGYDLNAGTVQGRRR